MLSILVIWANKRTRWFWARSRLRSTSRVCNFPESCIPQIVIQQIWGATATTTKNHFKSHFKVQMSRTSYIILMYRRLTVNIFAKSKLCKGGAEPKIRNGSARRGCNEHPLTSSVWKKQGDWRGTAGPEYSDVRAKPTSIRFNHALCNSSVLWFTNPLSEQTTLICKTTCQDRPCIDLG
jgi:hypothetical protein